MDRWLYAPRLVTALVLCTALAAFSAYAQTAPSSELEALRRDTLARFEVMPLREGVALLGPGRERRVEIVDGLVHESGTPLSGAELRSRLGPDAATVLRLSYLDNASLRALFSPALPAPGASAPTPPPAPGVVTPPAPGPDLRPVPSPAPPVTTRTYRRTGARIAVGKSISVEEDEEVTDAVVAIGGRIRIAGRVRDDVVAIGGSVELLPTAEVDGDVTSLGGRVSVAPGARHSGAVHHATVRDWPGGAGWPVVSGSWLDLGGTGRWLSLAATLARVGLLAAGVSLVMLFARGRTSHIGAAAAASPFKAGAIGFGLQVVFVPALVVVSLALAITIIGLPFVALLVPAALVSVFLAMLLGFASLARAVGAWAAQRLGWDAPAAIGAAILGLALIVLPTVLARLVGVAPDTLRVGAFALLAVGTVVEYVAWTIGLGAAAMTGLGRWATAPPSLPPPADATPSTL